jgi:isocitrate dehydrogenase kinase/phosphatase
MADQGKTLTASRLANDTAPAVAEAFAEHQRRFQEITRRARSRFDTRDWRAMVGDAVERLDLYGAVIDAVEATIRDRLGDGIDDRDTWTGIKAVYSGLIGDRDDREIAETFFNSVTRRIFATVGVDANIEFVETDADRRRGPVATLGITRVDRTAGSAAAMAEHIVRTGMPGASFDDLATHAGRAADRVETALGEPPTALEIVSTPFFRRKGAYLVGRALGANAEVPFALALLHDDRGVGVDAVLLGENDLSILFSFTRSHFHVDAGPPSALVSFLKRLMPRKPLAEIYIAIGFHKHGKTELYRDLLRHLSTTDGRFDFVPGTPGLVMVVFGMPGYDVVFKIIRDEIPAAKTVTRSSVMQKYRLVFRHDRAGRLVEAQEFEHLRFDRDRFTEELADELGRACGRHVAVTQDAVVVHHAYASAGSRRSMYM